jgi:hypothetical protein
MCAQVLLIGAKRLSIIDFSHQRAQGCILFYVFVRTKERRKKKEVAGTVWQ